jgi:acylphosphatase
MPDDRDSKAVRARIHGRVTGVGYRYWTVGQARSLGLDGWVRNRSDDTVELVAVGRPAQVDTLIAACRQGPRLASVTRIDLAEADTGEAGTGFRQLPTL